MPRDGNLDLLLERSLLLQSIKLIFKPTRPKPAANEDKMLWPFLNQLSLNYLSLLNVGQDDVSVILKELLMIFVFPENDSMKKQIESIAKIKTEIISKVVRYHGTASPVRGIRIILILGGSPLGRIHPFLLGSVLNHYFKRLVSMNSSVQLQIETSQQGHTVTWSAVVGERTLI